MRNRVGLVRERLSDLSSSGIGEFFFVTVEEMAPCIQLVIMIVRIGIWVRSVSVCVFERNAETD